MGNDVWYRFIAAKTGSCTVTTCNLDTDYDTVLTVWGGAGCSSLVQLGCNDDSCGINPSSPNYYNSTVVFPAVANTQYWVSIGGYVGAVGTYSLKISQDDYLDFKFFDEGPGSVGFRVADTSGWYYFFVTTTAGNYPNGWLGGIDISFTDFFAQLHSGFPFHGPLTRCGVVGPFFGPPSGLTLYGVVFGAPAPGAGPTVVSAPASFTIP